MTRNLSVNVCSIPTLACNIRRSFHEFVIYIRFIHEWSQISHRNTDFELTLVKNLISIVLSAWIQKFSVRISSPSCDVTCNDHPAFSFSIWKFLFVFILSYLVIIQFYALSCMNVILLLSPYHFQFILLTVFPIFTL